MNEKMQWLLFDWHLEWMVIKNPERHSKMNNRNEWEFYLAVFYLIKELQLMKWRRDKAASSRCLKITKKVSFNIASEASYVYILSGQKLIKNAKNGPFWRVFENLKLAVKHCYQTGHF